MKKWLMLSVIGGPRVGARILNIALGDTSYYTMGILKMNYTLNSLKGSI